MTIPVPMPAGLRVEADVDTIAVDDDSLIGGSPRRVMRLSTAGRAAWAELRDGPVVTTAAGVLARRLTDAGLAHPRPAVPAAAIDVTVVIPARDRVAMLDRCLAALGGRHAVVVVDDGSVDPEAVAAVVRHHGARLVRHDTSQGPAAARNSGLREVGSEIVAFLDSDCVPSADWVARLAGHLRDPAVAAAAPRVVAMRTGAKTYLASHGALDLGDRAARVQPGSRVAFVPTAALVVRRSALDEVAAAGQVFDPDLRYGEDVDLVWRLDAAGWRVRFDPSVEVAHEEPDSWRDRVGRRFHYGTSAAPLSRRHPGSLAPVILQPWPTAVVVGLLTRRPAVALAAAAAGSVATRRAVVRSGAEGLSAPRLTAAAVGHTWVGLGRYVAQLGVPLVLASLLARRGRLALAALVVGPPLWEAVTGDSGVSPARHVLGSLVDDVAYGAGVMTGAVRHRTTAPVRPVVVWSTRTSPGAR